MPAAVRGQNNYSNVVREMAQVYNFSSGPAMLPAEVLKLAQQELCDWHGLGTSVMEISHRGKGVYPGGRRGRTGTSALC